MDIHYKNNSQFSEMIKNPTKFELPKYGPSTTDPTYYEPQATRIANMRKSAQSFEGLYDFTGNLDIKGKSKEEIFAAAEKRTSTVPEDNSDIPRFSAAAKISSLDFPFISKLPVKS